MRLLRRRRRNTGSRPIWDADSGGGLYMHSAEIDQWRAVPFDMPPAPERSMVLQRVRQITESLEGAIDEGTGAALDPLIESWVAAWVATVEADYTDHCAVINVRRAQATQWLAESSIAASHEEEELGRLHAAYLACRSRLADEQTSVNLRLKQSDTCEEISEPRAVPDKQADWAAPHLLAGRSRAGLAVAGLLLVVGALTDAIAFQNTLALVLPQASETLVWLMASGATILALTAAASLGISLAIRRRTNRNDSRFAAVITGAAYGGLGFALFLARWLGVGARTTDVTLGGSTAGTQLALLVALFFAAIYLISGAGTMFESERLYNPEYVAFRRLAKQHRKQAQKVAAAEATVDRARSAVKHYVSELDREGHRRQAAIGERRALGAEAANYARLLMAAMLKDPAKTSLTETGPLRGSLPSVAFPDTDGFVARPKAHLETVEAGRDESTRAAMDPVPGVVSSRDR